MTQTTLQQTSSTAASVLAQPAHGVPIATTKPASSYNAEVRFGIVMYGGVSLAIYINGVTNELFELVCATTDAQLDNSTASGTREIYRRLSLLAANRDLRTAYAAKLPAADSKVQAPGGRDVWQDLTLPSSGTRFVVDVISGTSAGGINGIFLAKALATGQDFGVLKKLWIEEGDFSLLLNDDKSRKDIKKLLSAAPSQPKSLLNSDRMYLKLLEAMKAMQTTPASADGKPLVDEVDLFVTTTDIAGTAVPLRLFDKVVYELRHKQNYHFRHPLGAEVKTTLRATSKAAWTRFWPLRHAAPPRFRLLSSP